MLQHFSPEERQVDAEAMKMTLRWQKKGRRVVGLLKASLLTVPLD
jgi:hypothetical protein